MRKEMGAECVSRRGKGVLASEDGAAKAGIKKLEIIHIWY